MAYYVSKVNEITKTTVYAVDETRWSDRYDDRSTFDSEEQANELKTKMRDGGATVVSE